MERSREPRLHEPALSHHRCILVLDLYPRGARTRVLFATLGRSGEAGGGQLWAFRRDRHSIESGNALHSMESSLAWHHSVPFELPRDLLFHCATRRTFLSRFPSKPALEN